MFGNQQTDARSGPIVRTMQELSLIDDAADIADRRDSRLARHLTVVVTIKVVALLLLWALFFRAAP